MLLGLPEPWPDFILREITFWYCGSVVPMKKTSSVVVIVSPPKPRPNQVPAGKQADISSVGTL